MPRPPTTTAGNARATPAQQTAAALGRGALYCFEDFFVPIRDYGPCIIYVPMGTYLDCPARTYVRGNYYGVEIDLTLGPSTVAVPSAGDYPSLFGEEWLVVLCDDLSLCLYKVENGGVTLTPWDVAPPVMDASAEHVSLAFDQTARPVIAWQQSDGIHVRQYDEIGGAYAFTGPYAGTDPVLLNDAAVMFDVGLSDVILFYLSADRLHLKYRIQSENFVAEHNLYDFAQAVLMDSVDALPYRYQIRYALAAGDPDTSAGVIQALRSLIYPVRLGDPIGASLGPFNDGLYKLVAFPYAFGDAAAATVGAFLDGEYAKPVIPYALGDAPVGSIGIFGDGLYKRIIIDYALDDAAAASVASLSDGLYKRVIFSQVISESASGSIGAFGDGSYA